MTKETTQKKSREDRSHAEEFAHWLDDRFEIPGTDIRFGLDPIISLIPGAGDWLGGLASSYFILLGVRAGVAPSILLRMGFNVIFDVLIGSIPLLGDIFDFGWKANTRNAELLDQYQRDASSAEKQSRWLLWGIAAFLILVIIGLLVLISWLMAQIFSVIFL